MTTVQRFRSWSTTDDRLLAMMAAASWSIHMAAAQLARPPVDIETRAAIFGYSLHDRTAGESRCPQCNRLVGEECPFHANFCTRKGAGVSKVRS